MRIFYRQGGMFKIDDTQISPEANNPDTKNALYAAVYQEFKGAVENLSYKHLTSLEKMDKLNEFAENWLRDRGLL